MTPAPLRPAAAEPAPAGPTPAASTPAATVVDLPVLPALVVGRVAHVRRGPIPHRLTHRVYQWLVDVDDLPRFGRVMTALAAFDPEDHLGGRPTPGSTGTISGNVRRFLTHHGIDLGPGGRIVMLANARVLGYVFDPLTVFWCFAGDARGPEAAGVEAGGPAPGDLIAIVAEVHNTYGDRHAYLLHPDDRGRDRVAKQLYVSPFNDVSGEYELSFGLSAERVAVSVVLRGPGGGVPLFAASFVGRPQPASTRAVLTAAARRPLMPHRVSALIRWHGIRLWVRRLPIQPRPVHRAQNGV